ncbi:protein FAR1-RELATED SEQUENCE 5-like [Gossypium australe]|uniref:Protein FAR1-RELATED SEQUENCE 5-like n=1 Tax=Gossypium australe TaxID=47621 RepID=A0A5B6UYG9_9ROSI|nr:protein FAR1-RELATED SEQUENCE 5-like [Gossypium australe]
MKLLEEGDAQRLYKYFKECETTYLVDYGCMGNYFWVDAISRMACQYFGDVATFDATYVANQYDMPFVPLIDVNHHQQSIMFGCALLLNETTKSYICC